MVPCQAKEEAKTALTQHGLLRKGSDAKSTAVKIPNSDQLSFKRVDPSKLEVSFEAFLISPCTFNVLLPN